MNARREFLGVLKRLGLAGMAAPLLDEGAHAQPSLPQGHFDLVVIGTGFGGTMTALTIAYTKNAQAAAAATPPAPIRILLLERGTWWTTSLETVQDKQVTTRDFLIWHKQPTQEWSSLNDARGMVDLIRRCRRSDGRPQGLYEFTTVGKRGVFNPENDGVAVLRASGVGGGSLVYSNITIRPPENLFDDPRWPGAWRGKGAASQALRAKYYTNAAASISKGIEWLVVNGKPVNTGLSNILTRSGRLEPSVQQPAAPDPTIPPVEPARPLLQIKVVDAAGTPLPLASELIDRARVFQTAISQITPHYGSVDLAINDLALAPEPGKPEAKTRGRNYCERQGRCNIGCLPGARHTLNKQLMRALFGDFNAAAFDPEHPTDAKCVLPHVRLELSALAEVDFVSEAPGGGYTIHYRQRSVADPRSATAAVISADRVIVAASSLGTTELMLRSRQRGIESQGALGLRELSDRVGDGFSPNGDHIAFLDPAKERVSLTRGPVTTSFGQFNANAPAATGFHNVEDQGVPRSLAALTGYGSDIMRTLASGDRWLQTVPKTVADIFQALHQTFALSPKRNYPASPLGPAQDMSTDRPENEDELAVKMMCVVAQGKDDANGRFRLENDQLRLARADGKPFYQDPIYAEMRVTLDKLATHLRPAGSTATFNSPFFDQVPPGQKPMVFTSHPLGGCPMGENVGSGVTDEFGRVFRTGGAQPYYRGLYIADGSIIPTALGVNPSLTIAAVALRTADKILDEWDQIPGRAAGAIPALQCKV